MCPQADSRDNNDWYWSQQASTPASTGGDTDGGFPPDRSDITDARAFSVVVELLREVVGSGTASSASDTTARA